MSPYIHKLDSGKWQAQVDLPTGPGGQRRRLTKSHRLKAVVTDWARALEDDIASGRYLMQKAGQLTYAGWREVFMKARNVEPETLRGDQSIMRTHIAPYFDSYELVSIKPSTVKTWLRSLDEKTNANGNLLSEATKVRAFNLLRSSLELAVDDDLLPANPCARVERPAASKGKVHWFTRKQLELLTEQLNDRDAAMVWVMAWCGLRWGECAGIPVRDVHVDRRRIKIEQVVTQAGRIKAYPKNDPSVGEVPVPPHVMELLKPFMEGKKADDLLFVTERSGKPLIATNWRKVFDAAIVKANVEHPESVPHYTPHALRHTCASWLIQASVPLPEVQEVMRHATIVMTNKYAHLTPGVHSSVERAWAGMDPSVTLSPQDD